MFLLETFLNTVTLSIAKGLACLKIMRFFAEFILEQSEGLRVTGVRHITFDRDFHIFSFFQV